jgi:hypothetical protein
MNTFIAILGIVFSGAIALVVAYMHRRQIRQVEAHRLNPKVGLIPPPNKLVLFFRRNFYLLAFGTAAIIGLAILAKLPLSRLSVSISSLLVAGLVLSPFLDLLNRVLDVVENMSAAQTLTTAILMKEKGI